MTIFNVISLFGGLAMFLYGMEVMGDGLKQCAGDTLKRVLGKLTQNPLLGLLTGTLVTGIIQSSTATIVLTVGLIGAGILNLRQAASIVMGANIGTTITAQVVRLMDIDAGAGSFLNFFKPDTLAPIALVIGIILFMFVKKNSNRSIGLICLGFGILFMGLMLMSNSVKPLAESKAFENVIAYFTDVPVLGIIIGLVFTIVIQSSSAMVGILQALSSTGIMTFNLIYPIIMGINLGTCVTTAMVCSIGSSKDAKRTGVVHILFNVIGTVIFMIAMTVLKYVGAFGDLWGSQVDSGGIANFQTLFNIITAVLLVPFTNLLVKISCKIVKDGDTKENKYPELSALDTKLMVSPSLALTGASKCINAMASTAAENFDLAFNNYQNYNQKLIDRINENEEKLDVLTDKLDDYLVALAPNTPKGELYDKLNYYTQCLSELERIGDHLVNISETATEINKSGERFSTTANKELEITRDAVNKILGYSLKAVTELDVEVARKIEPLEEVIDDLVAAMRKKHIERLHAGICTTYTGVHFLDILTTLERISDHCSNIGLLTLSLYDESVTESPHNYARYLHSGKDDMFNEIFDLYYKIYFDRLKALTDSAQLVLEDVK